MHNTTDEAGGGGHRFQVRKPSAISCFTVADTWCAGKIIAGRRSCIGGECHYPTKRIEAVGYSQARSTKSSSSCEVLPVLDRSTLGLVRPRDVTRSADGNVYYVFTSAIYLFNESQNS